MNYAKAPSEEEVRKAFENVKEADGLTYARLNLNDFLLGYCMAKGMNANHAIDLVRESGVMEDSQ